MSVALVAAGPLSRLCVYSCHFLLSSVLLGACPAFLVFFLLSGFVEMKSRGELWKSVAFGHAHAMGAVHTVRWGGQSRLQAHLGPRQAAACSLLLPVCRRPSTLRWSSVFSLRRCGWPPGAGLCCVRPRRAGRLQLLPPHTWPALSLLRRAALWLSSSSVRLFSFL